METLAKQAPIASSEIVMLIRKLRWVGLEEKAEQLEKELEQRAVIEMSSRRRMRRTDNKRSV